MDTAGWARDVGGRDGDVNRSRRYLSGKPNQRKKAVRRRGGGIGHFTVPPLKEEWDAQQAEMDGAPSADRTAEVPTARGPQRRSAGVCSTTKASRCRSSAKASARPPPAPTAPHTSANASSARRSSATWSTRRPRSAPTRSPGASSEPRSSASPWRGGPHTRAFGRRRSSTPGVESPVHWICAAFFGVRFTSCRQGHRVPCPTRRRERRRGALAAVL